MSSDYIASNIFHMSSYENVNMYISTHQGVLLYKAKVSSTRKIEFDIKLHHRIHQYVITRL